VLNPNLRQLIASEMLRVVKADGIILWYDFYMNNPWNPDVQGMKRREIFRLFPGCKIELRRISLAPPLCRFLVPYSWLTSYILERLKIFNTLLPWCHYQIVDNASIGEHSSAIVISNNFYPLFPCSALRAWGVGWLMHEPWLDA